jgi:WD40 repeat protein
MQTFLKERKSKLFIVNDLLPHPTKAYSFTISPDGTYALVCSEKTYCSLIDLKSSKVIYLKNIKTDRSQYNPINATFSPDGTFALFCDSWNHCIYKMCLKTREASFFAGHVGVSGHFNGQTEQAYFKYPKCLIFSMNGKCVLFCDLGNHCIRRICLKTLEVSTFAGVPGECGDRNGPKEQALFYNINCITCSPDGTYILVSDSGNNCIRKICMESGQVSTFAGIPGEFGSRNGPKEHATFNIPKRLTFSSNGMYILVCDMLNDCIRKICLKTEQVTTFAGIPTQYGSRNGPKEQALFKRPSSITFTKCGKFIILCDYNNIKYIKIK